MNVRRLLVASLGSALMLGAVAMPASAGNQGDGTGYGTQPGSDVSASRTECAGHGAFGAFGKDYNLGNEQSGHYDGGGPGANGQATADNNSALCGNPQS